jgi:lambda repressor-like predicted transcriptional regulator
MAITSITITDQLTIDELKKRGVRIDALLKRCGISPYNLEQYLAGRIPAAWIRREIADAIGIDESQLWRTPRKGTSQTTPQQGRTNDDTDTASKGARARHERSSTNLATPGPSPPSARAELLAFNQPEMVRMVGSA